MHTQTRRTTHFFGTRGETTTEAGAETPGVCEAYGEDTWRAEVGCGARFRARPSTASCAVGCVGKKRRSLFDRTASSCQVGGAGAVGGLRIGVNPSLIKPMSPRSLVHASLCVRGGDCKTQRGSIVSISTRLVRRLLLEHNPVGHMHARCTFPLFRGMDYSQTHHRQCRSIRAMHVETK